MSPGLVIAAPASGSGKTVVTLGLLRALRDAGRKVASLKIGPDYIDPAFHRQASGRDCFNFDLWGMAQATRARVLESATAKADLVIAEGVMGLFDGARDGSGSTADAAAELGWPVILVLDVRGQGHSAAALIEGFARHRPDVTIAGVIFNRSGGPGHREILADALAPLAMPCLGYLPRDDRLALPSRHLGLVQAGEHEDFKSWIDGVGALVAEHLDLDRLQSLAIDAAPAVAAPERLMPPLATDMAIARDDAFAFCYPHQLQAWQGAGAALSFFSPLDDQAPDRRAGGIFLPGGYPELHAARLSANDRFLGGLRAGAEAGAAIYGECGGFMVLGQGLEDADGQRHRMAGLLPLETSFASPRLSLGYRRMRLLEPGPLGPKGARFLGHEFHYTREVGAHGAAALFEVTDALGERRQPAGCRIGQVMGSYMHIIDAAD